LLLLLILLQAAHYAYDEDTWELTDQYMFGADFMVAPVLNPVGSDSSSRANSDARNGGNHGAKSVASVKVYIPAKSVWTHLWTGQRVEAGNEGRYVAVDAPIGYPPVFYLPESKAGKDLRAFVLRSGYAALLSSGVTNIESSTSSSTADTKPSNLTALVDAAGNSEHVRKLQSKYTTGAVIGVINDYVAPDWAEWLGISQYVSKWNSTYYSVPSISSETVSLTGESNESLTSVSSVSFKENETDCPLEALDVSSAGGYGNSLMFQDIDRDLSSIFHTSPSS
jgi:Glycosyl hydrolases family 31